MTNLNKFCLLKQVNKNFNYPTTAPVGSNENERARLRRPSHLPASLSHLYTFTNLLLQLRTPPLKAKLRVVSTEYHNLRINITMKQSEALFFFLRRPLNTLEYKIQYRVI